MTSPCRIGIIGAGAMGRAHLDILSRHPAFEVVGVADPFEKARAPLAAQGIATFASHLELLDTAWPDAVVIATPNSLHVPAAIDCIERGVGVLIEKPVADSVERALDLVRVLQSTEVPVLVGHHRRHNPLLQKAAQHIAAGGIGRVVAVVGLWLRRKPDEYFSDLWKLDPARGGGVLLINTIHDIDCLRMLCGEIESVQAVTSNATRGLGVEDTAAVTLRFASGALGTLTVSDATTAPWCWEMTSQEDPRFATIPEDCYLVCGTQGSITVPTLETWTNEPNGGRDAPLIRRRLYHVPADAFTRQLDHFAALLRGECASRVTAADAARTLAATLAIRQSAATGCAIRIADLLGE
ncbi:Gfo/Idh/MocA family protein [Ramlibacter sp. MAHUQ-53]|uniref:Gfo/Idh/MocA family protein n=1 Tax=unclassified Ramlibacter TaxID=2617605 RepID=UPI00363C9BA5